MNFDIHVVYIIIDLIFVELFCQLKIKSLKQRSNLLVTFIVFHHTNTTKASCPSMALCKKKTQKTFLQAYVKLQLCK